MRLEVAVSWEAVGAIGEVGGTIVVAITLIYLVVQVRQNSTAIDATITQANSATFNELNSLLATSPELASLFERGSDAPESLTDEENLQYTWLMRSYMNLYMNLYDQYRYGTCPENLWHRHAVELAVILPSPGIQAFKAIDSSFDELFEYIEQAEIQEKAANRRFEHRI